MSFFNFNIDDRIVELLPPDKRYYNNVWFIRSLSAGIKWVRNLFFDSYLEGSYFSYAPGTYKANTLVEYDRKIYKSNIDNNTDIPTANTWTLVQSDYIGALERVNYTNQKLMLEYALNKEFKTNFNYPSSQNEIYITNNTMNISEFHVGGNEQNSSSVFSNSSTGFVGLNSTALGIGHFTVNIPNTLTYNENEMRSFIERYVAIGLSYNIHNY